MVQSIRCRMSVAHSQHFDSSDLSEEQLKDFDNRVSEFSILITTSNDFDVKLYS